MHALNQPISNPNQQQGDMMAMQQPPTQFNRPQMNPAFMPPTQPSAFQRSTQPNIPQNPLQPPQSNPALIRPPNDLSQQISNLSLNQPQNRASPSFYNSQSLNQPPNLSHPTLIRPPSTGPISQPQMGFNQQQTPISQLLQPSSLNQPPQAQMGFSQPPQLGQPTQQNYGINQQPTIGPPLMNYPPQQTNLGQPLQPSMGLGQPPSQPLSMPYQSTQPQMPGIPNQPPISGMPSQYSGPRPMGGMNQPPQMGGMNQPPPMGGINQPPQMGGYPQAMMRPPLPGQQFNQPGYGAPQPQQPMYDQQSQSSQKMDMDQIPNPIEVMEANNSKFGGQYFETNESGKMPPLILTNFVCKDMGNCNPSFIRSTMYSIPSNTDLLKQSKLPIVLSLTPFAELKKEEREPPVSDLGELGPVRCKRCKAYMSPFMQFIDNGKKFQCVFCEDVTQVPQEYFNHLDHMGKRVDTYERAELCCGSYEFVATKDYCRNQTLPQTPAFIFMIDVSINSVRSGLLHVLCPYIKNVILPNLPRDLQNPLTNNQSESDIKIGFVTYDKELHFYNLKSSLAAPQMMIVSDIEEVFVPILNGFLVKLSESRSVIENLLDSLPSMFQENKETELVFGPVIEAGIEALKSAGLAGKLFVFHTNLPNCLAPGQLKMRDDKKLLGTDKEKVLLSPQNDYYAQLGKKCVENGCSVDLFLMPNQYCDLATLSDLTRKTSGQIYKYDFFMADSHGERLCEDLKFAIESTVAFDAVMKVRTSTGIKPVDYLGNFSMYGNDIELAGVNRQTSLAVELKHEDKLNENSKVYIQAALLYTSLSGQRRIRVHNLSLNVCNQYSQMYSSCELDCLINYMAKLACRSITISTPKSIRDNLISQVSHILATYRKSCTNSPAKGQFILPETLKLLPVFSNSLLKSDAISGSQSVTTDERSYLMYRLMSMDIKSTFCYFYPRLLPVHDLDSSTELPSPVRCIYERIKDDGIYLLENGLVMYLWIGSNVSQNLIQNLFGVSAVQQLNVEKAKILEIDTQISTNLRSIIKIINDQRKSHLKLIVLRQGDSLEFFFKNYLVEDKGIAQNNLSYVEYLYHLHREIKTILS
ncbi:unnamed protein product [Brachionus calyciflorus]|uniref:Uncharacterized protein n=1 Tax=Brachionus calyciflorus TaxID=104777 RepID=A0A813M3Y9_9BILA|nr:unnamed protein product [Brachionus calyciflorus]